MRKVVGPVAVPNIGCSPGVGSRCNVPREEWGERNIVSRLDGREYKRVKSEGLVVVRSSDRYELPTPIIEHRAVAQRWEKSTKESEFPRRGARQINGIGSAKAKEGRLAGGGQSKPSIFKFMAAFKTPSANGRGLRATGGGGRPMHSDA